jgi:hypothetical protein
MELENNKTIPFLNLLIIRNQDKILFDWCRKPISSGHLLNWLSNHPYKMKINIGTSFANRVLTLSDTQFHQQNLHKITTTLKANNYPESIIKRIIYKSKNFINSNQINTNTIKPKYCSIPYIPKISEKLQKDFKTSNINFGMKPQRKLQSIFTNTKTKIKKEKIGHIYKINCLDCKKVYIGETSRSFGNKSTKSQRTKEHIYDYNAALRKRNEILSNRQEELNKLERNKTRSKQDQINTILKKHIEEDKLTT